MKILIESIGYLVAIVLGVLLALSSAGCATLPTNGYDSVLKYNYFNKEWSYQPQESRLIWNYMESRYEWVK